MPTSFLKGTTVDREIFTLKTICVKNFRVFNFAVILTAKFSRSTVHICNCSGVGTVAAVAALVATV